MTKNTNVSTEAQILDFSAFMEQALRTENVVEEGTQYPMRKYLAVLNLAETSSRVIDLIKRELYYSQLNAVGVRELKGYDPLRMTTMLDEMKEQIAAIEDEMLHRAGLPSIPNEDGSAGYPICGTGVAPIPPNARLAHGIIGKAGESGELIREWLEAIVDNRPVNNAKVSGELGDGGWFDAIIVDASGISLPAAYWAVIAKLKLRYPDAFTTEKSDTRDVVTEDNLVADLIGSSIEAMQPQEQLAYPG